MARKVLDVAAEFERLSSLETAAIRKEWQHLSRISPTKRLSRDMLIRGILYTMQERVRGGLSSAAVRRLEQSAPQARRSNVDPLRLKPGTRLVREWNGVTHTVVVTLEGFVWRDCTYRSLSKIAAEITGAHWSGPRFFGLRDRRAEADGS